MDFEASVPPDNQFFFDIINGFKTNFLFREQKVTSTKKTIEYEKLNP